MMRLYLNVLVSALIVFGCTRQRPVGITVLPEHQTFVPLRAEALDPIEQAIVESLVRYQTEHSIPEAKDFNMEYVFLSIGGKDPEPPFLQRLYGIEPVVRPASTALSSPDGFFDKNTGKRGIRFNYQAIRWRTSTQAEVEAQTFVAGLSAAGIVYTLNLEEAKWVVTGKHLRWEAKQVAPYRKI